MNKFEKIYNLIGGDVDCPMGCEICENGPLYFLPGEVEFISKKLKVPKTILANRHKFENHEIWIQEGRCVFYKRGRCMNRNKRPLDCRSQPVIPYKKRGKIFVELDRTCPLVKKNKIKKSFLNRALKAWKLINPPEWWLDISKKENKF